MPKRLLELDVFRGLAALAVLLCHYTSRCAALEILPTDFHYGAYGAHLFFIISGFVIFMTLVNTRHAADFLVSRFSRLYPVYWTAVVLAFTIYALFPRPEAAVSLPQAVVNMTMFQTWLRVPNLCDAYWTLAVELKFYALILLVYLAGQLPRIELTATIWLALAVAYRSAVDRLGMPEMTIVKTPLCVEYAQLFIAGILFYRLRTEGHAWSRHAILLGCLAAQFNAEGPEAAIVVGGFFAIFHLFVAGRLAWIARRPLVFLGTISYSLYLIHECVGDAMIPRMPWLWNSPAALMAVPLAASVLLAAAMTFAVERPALAGIRRYAGRVRLALPGQLPVSRGCNHA